MSSTTQHKRRKCTVSAVDIEPVTDGIADSLNKYKTRTSLQYYFAQKHHVEMTVQGFTGDSSRSDCSDLLIVGSHKHTEFFTALSNHMSNHEEHHDAIIRLPHLTMRKLNEMVRNLKSHPTQDKLSKQLTSEQIEALPNEFPVVCLPLDKPCLLIVDSRTIRSFTTKTSDASTMRWKVLFKGVSTSDKDTDLKDDYTCFPQPRSARKYEAKHGGVSPWPYILSTPPTYDASLETLLRTHLEKNGFIMLPLSTEHMKKNIEILHHYLHTIMAWPAHCSLLSIPPIVPCDTRYLFREPLQKQSVHIPAIHGRTHYGHYCPELLDILKSIEPIVSHVFHVMFPHDTIQAITTAEIIIQHTQKPFV